MVEGLRKIGQQGQFAMFEPEIGTGAAAVLGQLMGPIKDFTRRADDILNRLSDVVKTLDARITALENEVGAYRINGPMVRRGAWASFVVFPG